MQACAAGARYATFFFGHILLSHSLLGSTCSVRQMVGSQHAAKFATTQTAPTFTLYFSFRRQVPSGTYGTVFFFCGAKKNNIKWRRRLKKFRARCKNIAIYTTESLNEPFFAEHNMKTGAAGKKKI